MEHIDLYVWFGIVVIGSFIEFLTPVDLVAVWLILGGVGGLVVSACNGPIWLQVVVFAVLAIAALIVTKPIVTKLARKLGKKGKWNVDRYINQSGTVTQEVTYDSGQVKVLGVVWSARTESEDKVIAEGQRIKVLRIEGVKLIVTGRDKE